MKEKNHLLDATRYQIMSGLARAALKPVSRLNYRDWSRAGVRRQTHEVDYDPLSRGPIG
jgi:hypothetical protein